MSGRQAIEALLAGASELAKAREARASWVRKTTATWRKAQRRMDERCDAALDRLSEEEFERLCDEEEAKIDAFRAPLKAAAEHDRWPRHLYFNAI